MLLMLRHHQGAPVALLRRALAQALGPAAAEFPGLPDGDAFDADTEAALRRWQAGVGLLADGIAGPRCLALLGLLRLPASGFPMQLAAVRPLFPATKPANVERYLPYVEAAMGAMGLADRAMLLVALGTIRAETEGFVPISELPSQFNTVAGQPAFSAYEPGTGPGQRVGNTEPGDGARFKGRGFVQLTGRDNYRRYGQQLGLPLLEQPDLANAPEVAALLLAAFLAHKAAAMRAAVAADDLKAARKLVNGGSHGLDRFRDVFARAPAPAVGAIGAALAAATRRRPRKPTTPAEPAIPPLTARRDAPDLRDRAYLPPPVNLRDRFPSDAQVRDWLPAYTRAGLILNQGQEGACTGFGLAGVVNYLRWRKAFESGHPPPPRSVSARMLYTLARRSDEYDGEDYEGSSCRGALKGWYHHGVCGEDDWAYESATPRFGYADRAAETPLGVYFRVALDSITDLQAAIQEVGAVYVSAFTHAGWAAVPRRARARVPEGHEDLPVIPWDGRVEGVNGHAFALVGFNRDGFVIQNSWGPSWGAGGFAVLRYDDWLGHAMDAWVAALGVAGVVAGRVSQPGDVARGIARATAAPARPWWDEEQARRHSVILGDDGRVARYLTEDQSTRTLLHQAASLPDQWFRSGAGQAQPTKRLLLYVHGGLNSERAALSRARALGRLMAGNGCYPLFVCWRTGALETLGHLLQGSAAAPAARGLLERVGEASDALLESTVARHAARPLWSEMKLNAELAFEASRGGHHLVKALLQLADTWGSDFELHLVGHSAGAIWLGHLLSLLARERPGFAARSLQLYAPACTLAFANRHFAPHPALMRSLHLDLLTDAAEREDRVGPYRKSLLYLVSQALEADRRTPLLGLARAHDPADHGWEGSSATGEALRAWRDAAEAAKLYASGRVRQWQGPRPIAPGQTQRAHHGGFDNDLEVVAATLRRITGLKTLAMPVDDLRGF